MTDTLAPAPRQTAASWLLQFVASGEIAPDIRSVSLVGDDLEGFDPSRGHYVILNLPTEGGALRRPCTITAFDPLELRIDVGLPVAAGDPAACWADGAQIGDAIAAELLTV